MAEKSSQPNCEDKQKIKNRRKCVSFLPDMSVKRNKAIDILPVDRTDIYRTFP